MRRPYRSCCPPVWSERRACRDEGPVGTIGRGSPWHLPAMAEAAGPQLMTKAQGTRQRIPGARRISGMELWDQESVELLRPAFIEFGKDRTGQLPFIPVEGWIDSRHGNRDRRALL